MTTSAFTSRPHPTIALEPVCPIRYDWLAHVARTAYRSKTLHLGVALAWLVAQRGSSQVTLTRRTLAYWNISRDAASDGLRTLQAERLLVVWRLPGRAPVVILTEPGSTHPLRMM